MTTQKRVAFKAFGAFVLAVLTLEVPAPAQTIKAPRDPGVRGGPPGAGGPRLSPQDFEQLIDLILIRTGWARISTLGKVLNGIDLEVENRTANEIAFVQVKSSATQKILDDYVDQFLRQRERYARMIFAVHSPSGQLRAPVGVPVHLWTCDRVAAFVVHAGLGEWVESRLA